MQTGFYNSTKNIHENAVAFFENREVTLDLICELAKHRIDAKKALEKAAKADSGELHTPSKVKIKRMSCAENLSQQNTYLEMAIDLYRSPSRPQEDDK